MTGIDRLRAILESKRARVEEAKRELPLEALQHRLGRPAPSIHFDQELRNGRPRFIAEIKRGSPSRGLFAPDLRGPDLARAYAAGGADAISVVTERDHFYAPPDAFAEVRSAVPLPLLKKDFFFDPWQLFEAKLEGADLVLLIVAALARTQLSDLLQVAHELGLDVLVEVHDEDELGKAVRAGARIIGINNRNLRDFSVDLATTERLVPQTPRGCAIVTESGIHTVEDVARLARSGVHAFLVGESLVVHANPRAHLEALRAAARVPV